jgi:BirA family transcriptional regulator, biotin operon repressor / biotin---[acetyl-CoA-carboxylase] ligase
MPDDITQTQIDILNQLKDQQENWTSPKSLGERLHLSIKRVNQSLSELLRWGYRFETNRRGDVRFLAAPDILFPHEITRGLRAHVVGSEIHGFRSIGSTNSVAHRHAIKNAPEGTIIIAGRQTAGRGRLGRSWMSPPKLGIYLSVILRPTVAPAQAPGLSLVAALAIAEAIRHYPGLTAMIKWPNDVLINGKKVAGVLTELSAELDRINYVIIGIGININHEVKDFPVELADKATSLRIEQGCSVNRVRLVQEILQQLEKRYLQFLKGGLKEQLKPIKDFSSILTSRISIQHDNKTLVGTAIDIDVDGALIVSVGKRTLRLSSGEISLTESY